MTNAEAKAIIEANAVPVFPLQIEYQDWLTAMNIVSEALEKQIPKKPKEYEDKFYACPVCRNVLLHKWKKYNTELMDKSNGLPYCLNCGQKLDWSEYNDE